MKTIEYTVVNYKGEEEIIKGKKSIRRTQAGNLMGYVGKTNVKNFGENNILAAMWVLDTESSEEALIYCEKNNIF